MAIFQIRFHSDALERLDCMHVIVPEQKKGPFGVLYLLHGWSADSSSWLRWTRIEQLVAELPLIVVMPNGGKSFYCNLPQSEQYEDHIAKSVVEYVDRTFQTLAAPQGRAIAGLSMGGYGAIMLAMRHPEVFSVACGHSGSYRFGHCPYPTLPAITEMADAAGPDKYDCFLLAERLAESGKKLAIRFDCGTEDPLLEINREFHAHLDKLRFPHQYAEYPGGHEWRYWELHVPDTLQFTMAHLQTERGGA